MRWISIGLAELSYRTLFDVYLQNSVKYMGIQDSGYLETWGVGIPVCFAAGIECCSGMHEVISTCIKSCVKG